jgi:hypothetical protein
MYGKIKLIILLFSGLLFVNSVFANKVDECAKIINYFVNPFPIIREDIKTSHSHLFIHSIPEMDFKGEQKKVWEGLKSTKQAIILKAYKTELDKVIILYNPDQFKFLTEHNEELVSYEEIKRRVLSLNLDRNKVYNEFEAIHEFDINQLYYNYTIKLKAEDFLPEELLIEKMIKYLVFENVNFELHFKFNHIEVVILPTGNHPLNIKSAFLSKLIKGAKYKLSMRDYFSGSYSSFLRELHLSVREVLNFNKNNRIANHEQRHALNHAFPDIIRAKAGIFSSSELHTGSRRKRYQLPGANGGMYGAALSDDEVNQNSFNVRHEVNNLIEMLKKGNQIDFNNLRSLSFGHYKVAETQYQISLDLAEVLAKKLDVEFHQVSLFDKDTYIASVRLSPAPIEYYMYFDVDKNKSEEENLKLIKLKIKKLISDAKNHKAQAEVSYYAISKLFEASDVEKMSVLEAIYSITRPHQFKMDENVTTQELIERYNRVLADRLAR